VINITGRVKVRLEDNIRMDLKEIWWESVNWVNLAQDREKQLPLLKMVMNFWAAKNSRIC
jgi:hypothetical protein